MRRWLLFATLCLFLAAPAVAQEGKVLRFSFQSDVASLDPHFFDHAFSQGFLANTYEGLVRWDDELKLEPALATEWALESPTSWVFRLRRSVTFHEGQPFTADDVVFSYNRAMGPDSGYAGLTSPLARVEKIDDFTVRIVTKAPYAILPRMATNIFIMSRGWAEANNATASSNLRTGVRNYAASHANGTGPFRITKFESDTETRFAAFPGWWDKPGHNLREAVFRPIKNSATRVAALMSQQVDMIWPVPLADIPRVEAAPGLHTSIRPSEWVILLRLNQGVDQIGDMATNPFKDARVREAFYRSLDLEAIRARIMRNHSVLTGLPLAPTTNGYAPDLNNRPAYDPQKARSLLAEAGYADGVTLTLDCPNDRFINDEAVCRAVIPMLARAGFTANLASRGTTQHFSHLQNMRSEAFMVGWASAGVKDGHNLLSMLFATRQANRGAVNYALYSNAELDGLIDAVGQETDEARRAVLFHRALEILQQDWAVVPVHIQPSAWATADRVKTLQLPDDNMRLWRTRITD